MEKEPLDKWMFEPTEPIQDQYAYRGAKRNKKGVLRTVHGESRTEEQALQNAKDKARRVDIQELVDEQNNV